MKVLVFSDVHGNLPALELMLKRERDVDQYICLGDVVNYGPWSQECVELVTSLESCIYLLGNHETSFLEGSYEGTHPIPQQFYQVCRPGFKSLELIKDLPEEYFLGKYRFVHTLEDRNIYPDSEINLQENVFIGHSHHQFHRNINGFDLYNTGSVGQNRKFINVINYALFFPEEDRVELQRMIYDEQLVINEMRNRNFPEDCIAYYEGKKRTAA